MFIEGILLWIFEVVIILLIVFYGIPWLVCDVMKMRPICDFLSKIGGVFLDIFKTIF